MPANLHLQPRFRDRLSYLYVEHAVIERNQNAIAFFDDLGETHVPIADIALLMLGPGTKLTHAAVDVLSRNNCLIAWVGEECVRMYAFGTGGTHSAGRLLRQAAAVSDMGKRMEIVRKLYSYRFPEALSPEFSLEQIRGKEGYRVRAAYQKLAEENGIEWEGRSYDRNKWVGADKPNAALSAANSCLYGVCHAAILSMGFSAALGFIHTGKQLSFVYDLADLYKLELSVPVAFREAALEGPHLERRVRYALRDTFRETRFLERVAKDLLGLFGPDDEEESEQFDDDPAMPGRYWDGAPGGENYTDDGSPDTDGS
jgi:CRISPR-associated protein Cas1